MKKSALTTFIAEKNSLSFTNIRCNQYERLLLKRDGFVQSHRLALAGLRKKLPNNEPEKKLHQDRI
ncbi:MAG: hypothetical protein CSA20_03435 [Deltaproteobacteria bacterium]|nr:MAG: hypothetical protein CSA20_03435 [Deltaproteobacteria bacterium]